MAVYYYSINILKDQNSFARFRKFSNVFEEYKKSDNPVVSMITIK